MKLIIPLQIQTTHKTFYNLRYALVDNIDTVIDNITCGTAIIALQDSMDSCGTTNLRLQESSCMLNYRMALHYVLSVQWNILLNKKEIELMYGADTEIDD